MHDAVDRAGLNGHVCKNRLKPQKKKWHAMNNTPEIVAEVKNIML